MQPGRDVAFTVLLVCTGNICRSALGERLGRAYLEDLLGDDAGAIRLVSAGTRAVVGSGMHPDSALVLRGLGAEPGDFRARQLIEGFVREADLTLTMTSEHRNDVLALAPRALSRTFTLREAADLLRLVGEDLEAPGEGFAEGCRRLVREMAAARSRRHSGADDDIRDPIGRPIEVHDEVADAITDTLLPVLRRFSALLPVGSPQPIATPGGVGPGDGSTLRRSAGAHPPERLPGRPDGDGPAQG